MTDEQGSRATPSQAVAAGMVLVLFLGVLFGVDLVTRARAEDQIAQRLAAAAGTAQIKVQIQGFGAGLTALFGRVGTVGADR